MPRFVGDHHGKFKAPTLTNTSKFSTRSPTVRHRIQTSKHSLIHSKKSLVLRKEMSSLADALGDSQQYHGRGSQDLTMAGAVSNASLSEDAGESDEEMGDLFGNDDVEGFRAQRSVVHVFHCNQNSRCSNQLTIQECIAHSLCYWLPGRLGISGKRT